MFSGAGNVTGTGQQAGPVNYDLARQLASSSIGFVAPGIGEDELRDRRRRPLGRDVARRCHGAAAGTTKAVAWTPTDWIDNTLNTWKRLCDPVAEQISTVWASALPEEAKAMAGPLLAMMSQMGGMAFGSQLGQALGKLSKEVLTSTDIGLPLGPPRASPRCYPRPSKPCPRDWNSPPVARYSRSWPPAKPPITGCSVTCRGCPVSC